MFHTSRLLSSSKRCLLSATQLSSKYQLSVASLHTTLPSWEKVTMKVPSMGDSITDGTIISIEKRAGEGVHEDDVLVAVETDKVTVDVRSQYTGVVVEYFCDEGDEVSVGSPLVTIDTDGTVTESKESVNTEQPPKDTKSSQKTEQGSAQKAPEASNTKDVAPHHGHTPLIQFRHGKANKNALQLSNKQSSTQAISQPTTYNYDTAFPSKAEIDFLDTPPLYGRPVITDAEADAIAMGGLDL